MKVYVVVAVLLIAGDHVPEIPFREIEGNGAKLPPAQIGGTTAKFGITSGVTVTVKVCVVVHCPILGVNV